MYFFKESLFVIISLQKQNSLFRQYACKDKDIEILFNILNNLEKKVTNIIICIRVVVKQS